MKKLASAAITFPHDPLPIVVLPNPAYTSEGCTFRASISGRRKPQFCAGYGDKQGDWLGAIPPILAILASAGASLDEFPAAGFAMAEWVRPGPAPDGPRRSKGACPP
jgi:hypothetical protein